MVPVHFSPAEVFLILLRVSGSQSERPPRVPTAPDLARSARAAPGPPPSTGIFGLRKYDVPWLSYTNGPVTSIISLLLDDAECFTNREFPGSLTSSKCAFN